MSCNYADGLSPYDNKGILGLSERFDSPEVVKQKCEELVKYIKESQHIVFHTGAGISTSAGIPDFRGPKGVWTLEEKGLKPDINVSFADAKPTKTHMAIRRLIDEGLAKYVVSQNIDGLHLKSGVKREHVAELHGNMFVDQCNICKKMFVRSTPTPTVGLKVSDTPCKTKGRPCRGRLQDSILDWEDSLPDDDLELSDMHASIADLSICLGTTLQIVPSGNIPLNTLRTGGKLVICNLQPTKHDNKADLIINTYVDDVMKQVLNMLGYTIPKYNPDEDPTFKSATDVIDWTVKKSQIVSVKSVHRKKCFGVPKKRVLAKRPSDFKHSDKPLKEIKKRKGKRESKPKPEKVKKPKREKVKLQKSKPEDSDSDIIVINDEDSDGSDVIFIDEDAEKQDVNVKSHTKDVTNDIKTDDIVGDSKECDTKGNLSMPSDTKIIEDENKPNVKKEESKSPIDDVKKELDDKLSVNVVSNNEDADGLSNIKIEDIKTVKDEPSQDNGVKQIGNDSEKMTSNNNDKVVENMEDIVETHSDAVIDKLLIISDKPNSELESIKDAGSVTDIENIFNKDSEKLIDKCDGDTAKQIENIGEDTVSLNVEVNNYDNMGIATNKDINVDMTELKSDEKCNSKNSGNINSGEKVTSNDLETHKMDVDVAGIQNGFGTEKTNEQNISPLRVDVENREQADCDL